MKKVIILKGLPASGKSTWAKQMVEKYGYKRVNKDDIREMVDSGKYSKENEKIVIAIRNSIVLESINNGKNVIVDDTNLNPIHLDHIRQIVAGKATVDEKFFDVSLEECINRDKMRDNPVGEEAINKMYNQWIKKPEPYIPDDRLPKAVIFDIDGTIATKHDRSPFDWDMVNEDAVNEDIRELLNLYKDSGYKIIIFTGRDGCCEFKTKQWLKENNIYYDYFDIRPEGSNKKDYIVKEKMLREAGRFYCIKLMIDDRIQVINHMRNLGIRVLDVAGNTF